MSRPPLLLPAAGHKWSYETTCQPAGRVHGRHQKYAAGAWLLSRNLTPLLSETETSLKGGRPGGFAPRMGGEEAPETPRLLRGRLRTAFAGGTALGPELLREPEPPTGTRQGRHPAGGSGARGPAGTEPK